MVRPSFGREMEHALSSEFYPNIPLFSFIFHWLDWDPPNQGNSLLCPAQHLFPSLLPIFVKG